MFSGVRIFRIFTLNLLIHTLGMIIYDDVNVVLTCRASE